MAFLSIFCYFYYYSVKIITLAALEFALFNFVPAVSLFLSLKVRSEGTFNLAKEGVNLVILLNYVVDLAAPTLVL